MPSLSKHDLGQARRIFGRQLLRRLPRRFAAGGGEDAEVEARVMSCACCPRCAGRRRAGPRRRRRGRARPRSTRTPTPTRRDRPRSRDRGCRRRPRRARRSASSGAGCSAWRRTRCAPRSADRPRPARPEGYAACPTAEGRDPGSRRPPGRRRREAETAGGRLAVLFAEPRKPSPQGGRKLCRTPLSARDFRATHCFDAPARPLRRGLAKP